jgi:hypothetical protein
MISLMKFFSIKQRLVLNKQVEPLLIEMKFGRLGHSHLDGQLKVSGNQAWMVQILIQLIDQISQFKMAINYWPALMILEKLKFSDIHHQRKAVKALRARATPLM